MQSGTIVCCSRFLILLASLPGIAQVHGQSRSSDPHVAYVYPAGGQIGTQFEIVVGGQYLNQVRDVSIAAEGVTATIVDWYRPLTDGQFNRLRRRIDAARERLQEQLEEQGSTRRIRPDEAIEEAGLTEAEIEAMEVYRQQRADPKRQPNEQLAEELTVRVTIDETAKPGKCELRLLNETAMSNPLVFKIGAWREVREGEIASDPLPLDQPLTINGQIMPGEVDEYALQIPADTSLVIRTSIRELIPYLADAVPGWFQGVVTLYDPQGQPVAESDSFGYHQDPVLTYEVAQSGVYRLRIRDSIYRGREDFVYRIQLGEIPLITSVFPLGIEVGEATRIYLVGENLSNRKLEMDAVRNRRRRIQWLSAPQDPGVDFRFPLDVDRYPAVRDKESNDTWEDAQSIPARCAVDGRIHKPGDRDLFRFEARGRVVIDLLARRAGSQLDGMLTLWDEDGNQIGFSDDLRDESQALETHHADPSLVVRLPGMGNYTLEVRDACLAGGRNFVYRLKVRPPQPEFELRVVPASFQLRPGTVVPISVYALRRDGFDGDIRLELTDAPAGCVLSGGLIPGNADNIDATLWFPPATEPGRHDLEMVGQPAKRSSARADEATVALPAEDMMQAFIWHHLVPAEDWTAIVTETPRSRLPLMLPPDPEIEFRGNKPASLPVRITSRSLPVGELRFSIFRGPEQVQVSQVARRPDLVEVVFDMEDQPLASGTRGNLILQVSREQIQAGSAPDQPATTRSRDIGLLPAIPFRFR